MKGGWSGRPAAQAGFTLVELLVTVTVIAILAVLAVPSFSRQMANTRLDRAAIELAASIALTRSQAMISGRPVDLRPGDSAQSNWNSQPDTLTRPPGTNARLDSAQVGKVSWYISQPSQGDYAASVAYMVHQVVTVDPRVVVTLSVVQEDGTTVSTNQPGLSFNRLGSLIKTSDTPSTGADALGAANFTLSTSGTTRTIILKVQRNGSVEKTVSN